MNEHHEDAGIAAAERARIELYDTLAQLRDRLDYAQRIDDSVARTKRRLAQEQRDNPLLFGAAVIGVAAAAGVAVWAVANKVMRAFD